MKKTILTLTIALFFLTACVVQNAGPEVPDAPDMGFATSYRNTEVFPGCDDDESGYLLFEKEGIHQIGLKEVKTSNMGTSGVTLNSATFHVKGDDTRWQYYEIWFSAVPVGAPPSSAGFNEKIKLWKGINGQKCADFKLNMGNVFNSNGQEFLVTVSLAKENKVIVSSQGQFVIG